jgi:hypothetical protein
MEHQRRVLLDAIAPGEGGLFLGIRALEKRERPGSGLPTDIRCDECRGVLANPFVFLQINDPVRHAFAEDHRVALRSPAGKLDEQVVPRRRLRVRRLERELKLEVTPAVGLRLNSRSFEADRGAAQSASALRVEHVTMEDGRATPGFGDLPSS